MANAGSFRTDLAALERLLRASANSQAGKQPASHEVI